MASAVFTEAILIVASVIVAGSFAGLVMGKVGGFQSTFVQSSESQKQIILTKIKIIYATNSSSTNVNAWIKNIGVSPITNPKSVDVYFGQIGAVQRIPYTGAAPSWTYASSVSLWNSTNTVQINISNGASLQKGSTYLLQVTTPNGVSDQYFLSP